MAHIVRLYVDQPLGAGQSDPPSIQLDRDQANRLFNVMRLGVGAELRLFNGSDGEWRGRVTEAGKRSGTVALEEQTAPQRMPPDLWLLFAPIKKDRTDFIVEKAAELGAARIMPVQTDFTNAERIRQDRLAAHAVAAAEQCGGTYVPEVAPLEKLSRLLDNWPEGRALMFCDEAADAGRLPDIRGPWAIVIGPEGGFSEAERTRLASIGHTVSLGPRILRADTAAVAALTLWQSQLGDWS
ncbi:MAG: 16S rRNA (uracil(1498)-N(3))-methyltransferase [Pseudomonadota bacterium]